ncbi:MAG: uroporphyrinogen decarboxylase family protein [Candidatus Latescibacterota bacterium]
MNQLECFKATVEHREHQQFLFYAGFTPDLEKRIKEVYDVGVGDIRDFFGMYNPVMPEMLPPEDFIPQDFSRYFYDSEIPKNAFINPLGVLEIPGSMYHFTKYVSPLRHAERFSDIETFPYPDVTGFSSGHFSEEVNKAHATGKVAGCWIGHMYEDSWQIRGYEQFLMDMICRPEWCEYILDRVKARNIAVTRAAAQAGVDWIKTGDDVANQKAMMFSPELWRKFMKPRWAEVFALAKSIKPDIQIWYHSDGNIDDIVPELIEIGVTILNPVQPECLDLTMIKRKYGGSLVLDGTIGTQTTMPFGSPDEVSRIVRERVRTLGYDGALILSPTHVLEPEVPLENIRRFVETAGML